MRGVAVFVLLHAVLSNAVDDSVFRNRRNSCTLSNGTALNDNIPCNDGDSNTSNDVCVSGVCKGTCIAYLDNDVCVSVCPPGKVADQNTCVALQAQCGARCLECASDGLSCARCAIDKYLDGGNCVSACRAKDGNGNSVYTQTQSPPGKYCADFYCADSNCINCASMGSSVCTFCKFPLYLDGGVCSTTCRAKDKNGKLRFKTVFDPTLGRICESYSDPSASSSSSSSLSSSAKTAIFAGAAGLGLVIILVLVYIFVDKRKRHRFEFDHDLEGDIRMEPIRPRLATIDIQPVSRPLEPAPLPTTTEAEDVSASKKVKWAEADLPQETKPSDATGTRKRKKKLRDSAVVDAASETPATAHVLDSTASVMLTSEEAERFHTRLRKLRKHRETFLLMLKEMKKRAEARNTHKYDNIITDLTRLLLLFRNTSRAKSSSSAQRNNDIPIDGFRLLDWANKTLAKFMGQQSALMLRGDRAGAEAAET